MASVKDLQVKIKELENQVKNLQKELAEQKKIELDLRHDLLYTSKKLIEANKKLNLYPRYQLEEQE